MHKSQELLEKNEFRANAKKIRQNVINPLDKSKSILNSLINLPEFQNADTVFSYMSINTEVCTKTINPYILDEKKTLALPKVLNKSMEFFQVTNIENDVCKGFFNILEPKENLPKTKNFDVILVPAVAFSKIGHRIGYGAGFYDRYLSDKNGIFIGIAFDEQIFKSIPIDEFDIKMDILVTPTQILRNGFPEHY